MKEETADKIHEASEQFRQAIESGTGNDKVLVMWAVADETLATGITLGDGVDLEDITQMLFKLNGRAYKITQE